jgi:glycerol kinase
LADLLLALDQGTTSTRAILFRAADLAPFHEARRDLPQHFPRPGWVEHAPEDLVAHSLAVLREALGGAGARPADVAAIGITNQRETTLVWDRATGRVPYPAVVWQDRRTADACAALASHAPLIARRTGLVLDPYFSATKLAWLLDHVPDARARAARGDLLFGTVDSFLLWHLTEGRVHATDATNASRTMLYDIERGRWDGELLDLFGVPAAMLPEVRDSAGPFGTTGALGGEVAILGMAGDQQAAMAGQACFRPGLAKATFGTGCFLLLHTGARPVASSHRLLTTVALQLAGARTYALEGAVFVAGAAVQWLRDGLSLLGSAAESGELAAQADPDGAALLVPAFTGLGAPYWDPAARGALFNLTRATTRADLARAALDGVAHQTADLVEAMRADAGEAGVLRVDGGMAASDWTMQRVADLLGAPVDRPAYRETTALGAAYLAGLAAGLCAAPAERVDQWRAERRFEPGMDVAERGRRRAAWADAVRRTRG